MKKSIISTIIYTIIAMLFSCCDNVGDKTQSNTSNIEFSYIKEGKPVIIITGEFFDDNYYIFHNKGYLYNVGDNYMKVAKLEKTVGCCGKILR